MDMGMSLKTVVLLLVVMVAFIIFQMATFVGINGVFPKTHGYAGGLTNQKTVHMYSSNKQNSIEITSEAVDLFVFNKKELQQESFRTSIVETVLTKDFVQTPIVEKTNDVNETRQTGPFHYPGNKKTVVVIVAYNRPHYLKRTMESLISTLSSTTNRVLVDIVLSQDGHLTILDSIVDEMRGMIKSVLPDFNFTHIHHDQINLPGDNGYMKLSRHFGWFMEEMFVKNDYEQVIVLEDDLEIADDFFSYMDNTAPLLWSDPTIFCISAWNDNGQEGHVSEPERLYRSDFFPGLGWMLTKELWIELGSSWPPAYWDDWLRHPDRRKERVCIRPEVSRSYTFGESGTSKSQFYNQYLKGIRMNKDSVDFSKQNMDQLKKEAYDKYWIHTIDNAKVVKSLQEVPENSVVPYKIIHTGKRGTIPFGSLAKPLRIMEDEKAGVWRTAYMNVVAVKHRGTQLYLVPLEGPNFKYS